MQCEMGFAQVTLAMLWGLQQHVLGARTDIIRLLNVATH